MCMSISNDKDFLKSVFPNPGDREYYNELRKKYYPPTVAYNNNYYKSNKKNKSFKKYKGN